MDETEFEALCKQHWQPVLRYAMRRTLSPADAADVVSEVFVVAWRRRGEVPAGAEARLWLFGVARHALANQRRGAVRRSRLQDKLSGGFVDVTPDYPGADTPDSEDVTALRRALGELSDIDRELITLVGWEELTPTQAATALGVSAATVRVRLHRARLRLRRKMEIDLKRAAGSGQVVVDSRSVRVGEAR